MAYEKDHPSPFRNARLWPGNWQQLAGNEAQTVFITLAACNAIESETICSQAYDVTWYWISE